jgi:hypothetical protein
MNTIQNEVLATLKKITFHIEELVGMALEVRVQDPEAEQRQDLESKVWGELNCMLATKADYKKFYVSDTTESVEAFLVSGKLAGAQVANQVFRSRESAREYMNSLDSGTLWSTEIKRGKGTLWGRKPYALFISRTRVEYTGYVLKGNKNKKASV